MSLLQPCLTKFLRNHQRRLALRPWPARAQVVSWSFRPVFQTHPLITAPRFWLSPPVSIPASSGIPFLSTTPLLQPKSRFTAELAFLHLMVLWRFSTLAPHRLSLDEMFWIACFRLVRHPPRASRNAPLVHGRFWRIGPSETFDECAPERPIFSRK